MEEYNCLSRIKQEFQDLMNDPIAAIGTTVGMPDKNNPYEWRCTMMGPSDTSFRGGLFYLKIIFPKNYPNERPEVLFITPIYHVNVNHIKQKGCPLGHICISTLNYWQDQYKIREVLSNIFALFYLGNPESPYGLDRQSELMNNRPLFEEKIRYFTQKYASPQLGYKEYDVWDFTYPGN